MNDAPCPNPACHQGRLGDDIPCPECDPTGPAPRATTWEDALIRADRMIRGERSGPTSLPLSPAGQQRYRDAMHDGPTHDARD